MKNYFSLLIIALSSLITNAQTFDFLDINNVKARINANGDLFWDDIGQNYFEVPQGSGRQPIFAGALWIGGYDNSMTLRLAAQTYRQSGDDFWPGPITTDTINTLRWNRVWKVSRIEIDTFNYEFNHGFPNVNYLVPDGIQSWPGNGDTTFDEDHYLSPFIDANNDGNYNFMDGDYPCIKGDQAVYFIINDAKSFHGESFGYALPVQIHGMAYAFQSPDPAINNSIFLNYKIIYKGTTTNIDSTCIGNWTDFDLGNYLDDYIGCDVKRNMYYAYNGDANDEGPIGYGFNPPAEGVVFLKGPEADTSDGVDNDRDSCIDCTLYHTSSGDSIVPDNLLPEKIAMTSFMYYNNNNDPIDGNPAGPVDYFGYMQSIWRNGVHMTYGGNGHGGGPGGTSDHARFMYPGNSDPYFWGTDGIPEANWDEVSAGNVPDDRRGVAASGPFTIFPGGPPICIDYAYVYARTDSGGPMASLDSLRSAVDRVRDFYLSHAELQTCGCTPPSLTAVHDLNKPINDISVFPNPTHGKCNLQFNVNIKMKLEIEIVDQTGRMVRAISSKPVIGMNRVQLNLESLAKGIYFVQLKGENFFAAKKLTVN